MTDALDSAARAICRERCAFMGEPPCFTLTDDQGAEVPWPNPHCDEPGCHAFAEVALAALRADLMARADEATTPAARRAAWAEILDTLPDGARMSAEQLRKLAMLLRDANAKIDEARTALKPFADFADPNGRVPADMTITQGSPIAKRQLRMADCYRARAAIPQAKP